LCINIACLTGKLEIENYLHPEAIKSVRGLEIAFGDFDDVPMLVAKALHEASESTGSWDELSDEDRNKKESGYQDTRSTDTLILSFSDENFRR